MNRPIKHVLLLVKDRATSEDILRAMGTLGFIVYVRSSPAEAEARKNEYKHIDMAILDSQPGDPSIEEYALLLRSRFPSLPIICMATESERTRVIQAVPQAQIVVKPVSIPALLESFIY